MSASGGGGSSSANTTNNNNNNNNNSIRPVGANKIPIWNLEAPGLDLWLRGNRSLYPEITETSSDDDKAKHKFIPLLWNNLTQALSETKTEPVHATDHTATTTNNNSKPNDTTAPAKKKAKKERLLGFRLIDPFQVWIHIKEFVVEESSSTNNNNKDDTSSLLLLPEALPTTLGVKLSEVGVAGMINGMAAVPGGMVDKHFKVLQKGNNNSSSKGTTLEIETAAGPVTLAQLKHWSELLHQAVQSRLEKDVLDSTPQRIADMLAPDLTPAEFRGVRRRIYDTVILGKGLKVDDGYDDVPVANTSQSVHDIEKFKRCKVCGENDQAAFILDRKNGDVICSSCGTVHSESIMHEGSQFRKFEGEVDRNHHGDMANPLLSTSYNMSTSLGGVQVTSGAGMGGFGSNQNKQGLETILRNAHAFTELNVSSFGNSKDSNGRTRVGYKDKQKKHAFVQMNHVGDALNLHDAVIQRAKEIFAGFRDDRELLHQLKAVIAACLCEAFDQLAADGRKILAQQESGTVEADERAQKDDVSQSDAAAKKAAIAKSISTNRRAAKRADLHKASMAGKGGLFLDLSDVEDKTKYKGDDNLATATNKSGVSPTSSSRFEMMPAKNWDLEDCRSWLLEASRSIAQTWVDERDALPASDDTKDNNNISNAGAGPKKDFPKGSRDELEGTLVEHSIVLCEFLEQQLSKANAGPGRGGPGAVTSKRVVTPRVTDMSKLGIRWQHAHERGSGGKGGVGNSGSLKKRAASAAANSRRAGQILILQSSRKLGDILKNPLAGEYFHRELRALIGRQKSRTDKGLRDEATRQRLVQMQRKPWLQAKVSGAAK